MPRKRRKKRKPKARTGIRSVDRAYSRISGAGNRMRSKLKKITG